MVSVTDMSMSVLSGAEQRLPSLLMVHFILIHHTVVLVLVPLSTQMNER